MEGRRIDGVEELLESLQFLGGTWARRYIVVQGDRDDSDGEEAEEEQSEDAVLYLGHLGGLLVVGCLQTLLLVDRRYARMINKLAFQIADLFAIS